MKIFKLIILFILVTNTLFLYAAPIGTPDLDDIEYFDDEVNEPEEIYLGKVLFFDNRLSFNQQQSCATCHNPDLGFGDGLAKGLGTNGNVLERNTPHLYNLAWASALLWDGRANTLEQQAIGPIEAESEMNMPLSKLIPRLKKVPFYQKEFRKIYGKNGVTAKNIARAIAAFERTIVSMNSSFDQYISGKKNAMSLSAIRGMKLFEGKANCTQCHDGVNFTDDSFHNLGISDDDLGRVAIDSSSNLKGAFKTPGLRNATLTAPYMHDGSQSSLEEVIKFYNRGGGNDPGKDKLIKPLDLNNQEVSDLVAFLGALTDPVIIERPEVP